MYARHLAPGFTSREIELEADGDSPLLSGRANPATAHDTENAGKYPDLTVKAPNSPEVSTPGLTCRPR
jgi:hypothetical protein